MSKEFKEPIYPEDPSKNTEVVIIPREEIQYFVMESIRNSEMQILATMDLKEELQKPLSKEYHELVRQKLNNGVKFYKLGFGSKDDFEAMKLRLDISLPNYVFLHSLDVEKYRRMILVDKKHLFFGQGLVFCTTTNTELIASFTTYFENVNPIP